MDTLKVFYEFREKYPTFANGIVEYSADKYNSLKFKMADGKTAWYYPVEYPYIKSKKKKK